VEEQMIVALYSK